MDARRNQAGRSGIWLSVLGPVRAWRGDNELDLGPKQQRAILALLLTRPGQPVGLDELVHLLWEEHPPSSAVNVVHKYVGAIRRLLEPDLPAREIGHYLTRQSGGYRLAGDHRTIDLLEFRRLVRDARSTAELDPRQTLASYLQALSLWQGSCVEGLGLGLDAQSLFTAIDQEHVATVIDAAGTALSCGQSASILPLLRQAAIREPLNESVQACLILALAATGQQALALDSYHAVRNRLTEELGIDPGPELRMAHARVLRQNLGPEEADEPGEPAAATNWMEAGPLVVPAQLPADLPTFAGRTAELEQVTCLLDEHSASANSVVITAIDGMAGIGKTTLAVHWAHTVVDRFPDGQFYLNLRGFDASQSVMSPDEALRTLLYSLGVPTQRLADSLDAQVGMYRSLLAGKRVLLVLDNARDAEQVRPLLPSGPGSLVIVTSRNSLAPLAASEGAHLLTLELPSRANANETLVQRLGARRVGHEGAALDQIVDLCGRLPLALAIVSARAAAFPRFPLTAIADELRLSHGSLDAFDVSGGQPDARAAFSWSYQQLTPSAARLFRLLSLQPGPETTVPACASMLGVPARVARTLAAELRDMSLVIEQQPGRFGYHDLLRAYAGELTTQHDSEDERTEALSRLLQHYLHSAFAAQVRLQPHREPIQPPPKSPGVQPEASADYQSAIDWFTREWPVLQAAIGCATDPRLGVPAWQLALAMQQFYQWGGLYHEWMSGIRTALEAAEKADDAVGQGHLFRSLAGPYFYLGDNDQAIEYLERSRQFYSQLGYTTEHAYIHTSLGEVLSSLGEYDRAADNHRKALALYQEAGNRRGEARACCDLGVVESYQRHYDDAVELLLRGIALTGETGNLHQKGKALLDLGNVYARVGRFDDAIEIVHQVLDILQLISHNPLKADALTLLGDGLLGQADYEGARTAWVEARGLYELQLRKVDEVDRRLQQLDRLAHR